MPLLPRLQLLELEDQQWFPKTIRDGGTDFLREAANRFDIYKSAIPVIKRGLEKTEANHVIDICSGGGGGILKIVEHLKRDIPGIQVTLTDLYPNIEAFKHHKKNSDGSISYAAQSIDATDVPKEMKGLRTQFLSFHHFKPEACRKILRNAIENSSPIAIFEIQQRKLSNLLLMFFGPVTSLILTPFTKPFKWSRLLLTYPVPAIPFLVLFDGIVSVFRTYTVEEMLQMAEEADVENKFIWEAGITKPGVTGVLYMLGYPKG